MNGETDRWHRIQHLFQATLDRPEADRVCFLEDLCRDDSDLRRDVQSLLDAHGEAPSEFMKGPALGRLAADRDSSAAHITTGRRLGAYDVRERLGEGGMGVVYRARDVRLNRDVALKILPRGYVFDPDRVSRFEREVQLIAALNHPNIVTVYSVEAVDGLRFFTMELVEGKTLAETIPSRGLRLDEVLKIGVPIADAISAAHERGITHRDLKPANVMVTRDGRVKVLDFGLAKLIEPDGGAEWSAASGRRDTDEGRIIGTAAYMSPEQAEGCTIVLTKNTVALRSRCEVLISTVLPTKAASPRSSAVCTSLVAEV